MTRRARRWLSGIVLVLTILGIAAVLIFEVFHVGDLDLPEVQRLDRVVELPQNWKPGWGIDGKDWFHHTSQGTKVLPASWFMALERPELRLFRKPGRFASAEYLSRFGFLPSLSNPEFNPDGLPIGFAIDRDFQDPITNDPPTAVVGLTCAACHTGQVLRRDPDGSIVGIRVEGAPAMIHLRRFQEGIARSLAFTEFFPWRFDRFAAEVLQREKKADTPENRRELKRRIVATIRAGKEARKIAAEKHLYDLESGFGRTDALALIGNRVFGQSEPTNLALTTAPVNFPQLWDTPWFDWVQYNGSIRMPMVRNIGEALGVGAPINLDPFGGRAYASTVKVEAIHLLETLLAGPAPDQGLRPPRWQDAGLPPIDEAKRERGQALYGQHCAQCHLPARSDWLADRGKNDRSRFWTEPELKGERFLKLPRFDIRSIGTDPAQALNLYQRVAFVGGASVPAVRGLQVVTEAIRKNAYESAQLSEDQIAEWDRYRKHTPGGDDVVVARLEYKSRPLDGIWATAPYFHNGSVPNLHEVLLPARERSTRFAVGPGVLDTRRVGLDTLVRPGVTVLDTTLPGNRNTGHEFRNLTLDELEAHRPRKAEEPAHPDIGREARWARVLDLTPDAYRALDDTARWERVRAKTLETLQAAEGVKVGNARVGGITGVIGPEFTETERGDLVEFLKSL